MPSARKDAKEIINVVEEDQEAFIVLIFHLQCSDEESPSNYYKRLKGTQKT